MANYNEESTQWKRTHWIASLKEGDKVAVKNGSIGFRYYEILEIIRITPTGRITTSDGTKFDNRGREMGKKDTWSISLDIEPITEEVVESMRRRKILQAISSTNFKELSLESLDAIYEILNKEESKKGS